MSGGVEVQPAHRLKVECCRRQDRLSNCRSVDMSGGVEVQPAHRLKVECCRRQDRLSNCRSVDMSGGVEVQPANCLKGNVADGRTDLVTAAVWTCRVEWKFSLLIA